MVNFPFFKFKISDLYDKSIEELEVSYQEKWRENVTLENIIRIRLAKISKPKQCPLLATYIQSQLDRLAEFDHGKASQVTFAEKLLRSMPDGFLDKLHIAVEDHASPHCIEVSIFKENRDVFPLARWIVYTPRWGWPGIEVVLMDFDQESMVLKGGQKYFNPHSLIEHTCSLVRKKL